ncbi:hypothetical protein BDV09DRAFT_173242 [Aspergillus tetrazonus]
MRPSLVLPLWSKYGLSFISPLPRGAGLYQPRHPCPPDGDWSRRIAIIACDNHYKSASTSIRGIVARDPQPVLNTSISTLQHVSPRCSAIGPHHQNMVIYLPRCSSASLCLRMVAPVYPGYAASFSTIISSLFYWNYPRDAALSCTSPGTTQCPSAQPILTACS